MVKPKAVLNKYNCTQCNKIIFKEAKRVSQNKKRGYKNMFCNSSCSASYNNKNKKTGYRRSKLEKFVYKMLRKDFPKIKLSKPNTYINGWELDIYVPNHSIAIEIDGIFHYKPIFGEEKLLKIKKNDRKKTKMCKDNGIKLFRIKDTLLKFKEVEAEILYKKFIFPIFKSLI